jgi:hypothetical protein
MERMAEPGAAQQLFGGRALRDGRVDRLLQRPGDRVEPLQALEPLRDQLPRERPHDT